MEGDHKEAQFVPSSIHLDHLNRGTLQLTPCEQAQANATLSKLYNAGVLDLEVEFHSLPKEMFSYFNRPQTGQKGKREGDKLQPQLKLMRELFITLWKNQSESDQMLVPEGWPSIGDGADTVSYERKVGSVPMSLLEIRREIATFPSVQHVIAAVYELLMTDLRFFPPASAKWMARQRLLRSFITAVDSASDQEKMNLDLPLIQAVPRRLKT